MKNIKVLFNGLWLKSQKKNYENQQKKSNPFNSFVLFTFESVCDKRVSDR